MEFRETVGGFPRDLRLKFNEHASLEGAADLCCQHVGQEDLRQDARTRGPTLYVPHAMRATRV